MKNYNSIILVLLVCLTFMNCSKDDGGNPDAKAEYYFQYKVDGVQQDYDYGDHQSNLVGSLGYDEHTETYALNIAGIQNIFESGKNTLTIFVSDTEGFTTGINYSNFPGAGDDYPDFVFTMGYYDQDGNLYVASGQGDSPIYMELYEPAFVTFSEITDTYISGTFSGTLIWYDTSQGTNELVDTVVISEGKFKVMRAS